MPYTKKQRKEYMRKYREKPDYKTKQKEWNKKFRERNPDYYQEYMKKWRENNKEKIAGYNKKWRLEHLNYYKLNISKNGGKPTKTKLKKIGKTPSHVHADVSIA